MCFPMAIAQMTDIRVPFYKGVSPNSEYPVSAKGAHRSSRSQAL